MLKRFGFILFVLLLSCACFPVASVSYAQAGESDDVPGYLLQKPDIDIRFHATGSALNNTLFLT